MREHAQRGVVQVQAAPVQRRPRGRRRMTAVAVHLRRLAEQQVHRQVDGPVVAGVAGSVERGAISHHQPLLRRRMPDHRERTALALAERRELGDAARRQAEHIALLGFVAPQLHRRQRRVVAGHPREVDHAAEARVVQQLRDRVGQAAGADIVGAVDRVVGAERDAAVDHFLAAALHLRVVALHAREIERLGAVARRQRTGRAAAEADQHRRTTEDDHRMARLEAELVDLDAVDRAEATGEHDRLVVGAGQHAIGAGAFAEFERTEVTDQVRATEFVVERGRADRAVEHDLQRRCHARVERARPLPRLRQRRDAQVGDAETAETSLGLAAAAGRALVADLAAVAGARAGERRDRGRVVVGLDLDAERGRLQRLGGVGLAARLRAETPRRVALDHGGVVAVRRQGVLGRLRVGVLDHLEQRLRLSRRLLFAAVDRPRRVEDLVPAVLGVRLREHHQLDIGRLAAERGVALAQVGDLIDGQGQAEAHVGVFQLIQRDALELAASRHREQRRGIVARVQQRLRHRVVQHLRQCALGSGVGRPAGEVVAGAALDAMDRLAGTTQQLGRLARPRRQRAQARGDVPRNRAGLARGGGRRGLQDALQRGGVEPVSTHPVSTRRGLGIGLDPVHRPRTEQAQVGMQGLQAGLQPFAAER